MLTRFLGFGSDAVAAASHATVVVDVAKLTPTHAAPAVDQQICTQLVRYKGQLISHKRIVVKPPLTGNCGPLPAAFPH